MMEPRVNLYKVATMDGDLGNMKNCQNVRKTQRRLNYSRKIWDLGENVKYMI